MHGWHPYILKPQILSLTLDHELWEGHGEVIDVASREIVARLCDEEGRQGHSEKRLEIDFANAGRSVTATNSD